MFIASAPSFDPKEITFLILGGLGIFLFGIKFMGDGLKLLAGNKLRNIIEKYTSNPVKGVFVGIVTTVAIQSSSGTTALAIGLVRAGLMNLNQAVGIIMGANIGTTITAFLIGLKISKYSLPIMAVGAFFFMFAHKKKRIYLGQVLFGFGSLFYGLSLMSKALKPMKELPVFSEFMVSLSDKPILAVAVAAGITTIIQSSSAVIGIIQTLYANGSINLKGAIPLTLGSNIGTTVTAVLAALGGSIASRRASLAHVLFNIFGAVVFLLILNPYNGLIVYISRVLDLNYEMQVAFTHAIFNIVITLLLLPFVKYIVNAVKYIIPGKDIEDHNFLDEELLNFTLIQQSTSLALSQAKNAVLHLGKLTIKSLNEVYKYYKTKDESVIESVNSLENLINYVEDQIRTYLVALSGEGLSEEETIELQMLMNDIKDYERIGDHSENLLEFVQALYEHGEDLSEEADKDFRRMFKAVTEMVKLSIDALENTDQVTCGIIIEKENNVDKLERKNRQRHTYRITEGTCSGFASMIYVDALNDLERIGDHVTNIATRVLGEPLEDIEDIDYDYLDSLIHEDE